jgi:hypothetical protein
MLDGGRECLGMAEVRVLAHKCMKKNYMPSRDRFVLVEAYFQQDYGSGTRIPTKNDANLKSCNPRGCSPVSGEGRCTGLKGVV